MDASVYTLINANCRDQIVYAKLNLKIHFLHPMKEKFGIFKKLISIFFNSKRDFFNLDINKMISVCNTTVKEGY